MKLFLIPLLLASPVFALDFLKQAALINCSVKPLPQPGCTIGSCVNGQWQQNCSGNALLSCGPKPLPQPGCSIGECINNQWQQLCSFPDKQLQCGVKPLPQPGCHIGECIQGKWQNVCP